MSTCRPFRQGLLAAGYTEVSISGAHALAARGLPLVHGDPFDRLMIAQATVEGLLLLTADRMLGRYPGPVRVV